MCDSNYFFRALSYCVHTFALQFWFKKIETLLPHISNGNVSLCHSMIQNKQYCIIHNVRVPPKHTIVQYCTVLMYWNPSRNSILNVNWKILLERVLSQDSTVLYCTKGPQLFQLCSIFEQPWYHTAIISSILENRSSTVQSCTVLYYTVGTVCSSHDIL